MTYTTSLEISKELKEAGWKKETEFWWVKTIDKGWKIHRKIIIPLFSKKEQLPAPISDEILEELPYSECSSHLFIEKCKDSYAVGYHDFHHTFQGDTFLPNALAKMWIFLQKKGLLNKK